MSNLDLTAITDFWGIFEGFILVFLTLYALFSALIVRQIYLMNRALITGIAPYIKLIGWLHLSFALLVLFISFLIMV